MDVYPKFIIETLDDGLDSLILAKSTYHKQLATNPQKVKGGGWWQIDRENSIFTLYGDSVEFGRARIEDIAKCIQNKRAFSNRHMLRNYTDTFKFKYKDECGQVFDLSTYPNE